MNKIKHLIVQSSYLALIGVFLNGCLANQSSGENDACVYEEDYKKSGCPILPPSAERRLLDGLDARDIEEIGVLVYTTGHYSYLGITGVFSVNWGSELHYSYVLRKGRDEDSWENAKVYKWRTETIVYENCHGETITNDVTTLGTLLSLPENILSQMLYEMDDLARDTIWMPWETSGPASRPPEGWVPPEYSKPSTP